MGRRKKLNVVFPLGGLNRRASFRQQPPYATTDCLNVRTFDSILGRERGGSRPGLVASHTGTINGKITLLHGMELALGDGFAQETDTFSGGLVMSDAWSAASWGTGLPLIVESSLAIVDYSTADADAVHVDVPIDSAESYVVEAFISPTDMHHGIYRLYARMDDTTPDIEDEGVFVEMFFDTTGAGDYVCKLHSVTGGADTETTLATTTVTLPQAGWLTMLVSADNITVFWAGAQVGSSTAVAAQTGLRTGFGMTCLNEGGECLVDVFRIQFYSDVDVGGSRSLLVGIGGGDLFREEFAGAVETVTSDLNFNAALSLDATQSGQKLIIADYGDVRATGTGGVLTGTSLDDPTVSDWSALGIDTDTDVVVISNALAGAVADTYTIASVAAGAVTLDSTAGTGTGAYRIERAPKVYDPSDDTIGILTASVGQTPTGCPHVCRYLDRIVVAGASIAPHVWYMSRQGTYDDWDYSETDTQRAVAGTASSAGVPGSPVTALIPHADDYLIIACADSLWRMQGDPAYGGILGSLSRNVGCISSDAWCFGASNELIFLSRSGIYAVSGAANSVPVAISTNALPRELMDVNLSTTTVSLEYDHESLGIHIFITPDSSNERTHWWLDWTNKTFWPMSFDSTVEPTATCVLSSNSADSSGVLLGGRDQVLRKFFYKAKHDSGNEIESHVLIGPIPLGDEFNGGVLREMIGIMGLGSDDITWSIIPTKSWALYNETAVSSGIWSAGLNSVVRCGGRGQNVYLKIESTGQWAVDSIHMIREQTGRVGV